jgi:hypothetical protein
MAGMSKANVIEAQMIGDEGRPAGLVALNRGFCELLLSGAAFLSDGAKFGLSGDVVIVAADLEGPDLANAVIDVFGPGQVDAQARAAWEAARGYEPAEAGAASG